MSGTSSKTSIERARERRKKITYESYTKLYGSQRVFDLVDLLPARAQSHVGLVSQRDVERELTDDYLRDQLRRLPGCRVDEAAFSEIRSRCAEGIEAIVTALIRERRRGALHDARLRAIQNKLRALHKSLQRLTKSEIDSVTEYLNATCDMGRNRQYFIFLNTAVEFLYTGEMLAEPLPTELISDNEFKKEAPEQSQHPAEFWLETLLRLTHVVENWVAAIVENSTARSHSGRPPDVAFNTLVDHCYYIYATMVKREQRSHSHFRKFLEIVLDPVMPLQYQPKGGFNSVATTTNRRLSAPVSSL